MGLRWVYSENNFKEVNFHECHTLYKQFKDKLHTKLK